MKMNFGFVRFQTNCLGRRLYCQTSTVEPEFVKTSFKLVNFRCFCFQLGDNGGGTSNNEKAEDEIGNIVFLLSN